MADAVRLEYHIGGVRVMCLGSCDGTGANGCPICADDARTVARRDAAWREAVERDRELLREALDLVPRVSDDDPMAPALRDWCRSVRAALDAARTGEAR